MKYGKLIDGNIVYAPKTMRIDGRLIINPSESTLLANGYLPVYNEPPVPQEGFVVNFTRWSQSDSRIDATYQLVEVEPAPIPPRSLSKRKLYRAMLEVGIWGQVKDYMQENGVWEDWEYATTLDDDDPLMIAAISALENEMGIPHEQLVQILDASIAE